MLNYNSQSLELKLETKQPSPETHETSGLYRLASSEVIQAKLRKVIVQLERAADDSDVAVSDAVASFVKILEFISQVDGTTQNHIEGNFATQVDKEVNKIMIAFQFQDLLKQRLAYAITTLQELCSGLGNESPGQALFNGSGEAHPPKSDEGGELQDGETTIF